MEAAIKVLDDALVNPVTAVLNEHFVLQTKYADQQHLPLWMAEPIDGMAKAVGPPADQMRMVLCLLAALPLGFVHQKLPGTTLRHIFSLAVGVFYVWFVTGMAGLLHPIISSTVCYFLVLLCGQKAGWPVFVWSMLYMSFSHIYRLHTDYLGWKLDFTTAQMMVTIKMCTFGFNYADGLRLKAGKALHKKPHVAKILEGKLMDRVPNVLEYYSFIFFYGGVLAGPCFEIRDYLEFTSHNIFKKGSKAPPNTVMPTLVCVGKALVAYIGVFAAGYFPVMGYMNTDAFWQNKTWLWRAAYIHVAMPLFRFKYYFAWYLSEAGCQAAGFGFNGKDEAGGYKWDRVNNAEAAMVELAPNVPEIVNNWNKGANNWLKYYVYLRLPGGRTVQNFGTKLTSALWHGFYPAYYLFFIAVFFIDLADTGTRTIFRPLFWEKKDGKWVSKKGPVVGFLYNVVAWLLLMIPMNQAGSSFALLRADWTFKTWASIHYSGLIAAAVVVVLTKVFAPKRKRRDDKKTK